VHPLAIPCLAMSAINAYLGVYHLVLALRRPQVREQLPFGLLCLSVAAYDVFCVGLYNSTSLAQGVFWQRLQIQSVVLVATMTVWFIGRLTGTEKQRGVRWFIVWFAILTPISLVRGRGLTVSVATPAIKRLDWAGHPLITYYESDVGPIFLLLMASAFIAYLYVVYVLFRSYRGGRSRNILAILVGNIAYFAGVTNDSLVAARVYSFVYVSEYAFFLLTLSMAYVLLHKFVDLQCDVEALNVNLERTVVQRTAALQRSLELQYAMQAQLVETSRRSGKADVAADVLHNLGNALNSVNVSVGVLEDAISRSRLPGLRKVARMLGDQHGDLAGFFAGDPRGQQLPAYLEASTARLESEHRTLVHELASLRKHVDHINLVVATQQSHARAPAITERASLAAILEEALGAGRARHAGTGVAVTCDCEAMPDVTIDRHKLLLILANLLDNAWDAVEGATTSDKRIRIALRALGADRVAIDIEDNGGGILPDNLTRIFSYGFTTRSQRPGFGLHASACAAGEMNGTLSATSEGATRGARFTLTLPVRIAGAVDEPRARSTTVAGRPGPD